MDEAHESLWRATVSMAAIECWSFLAAGLCWGCEGNSPSPLRVAQCRTTWLMVWRHLWCVVLCHSLSGTLFLSLWIVVTNEIIWCQGQFLGVIAKLLVNYSLCFLTLHYQVEK